MNRYRNALIVRMVIHCQERYVKNALQIVKSVKKISVRGAKQDFLLIVLGSVSRTVQLRDPSLIMLSQLNVINAPPGVPSVNQKPNVRSALQAMKELIQVHAKNALLIVISVKTTFVLNASLTSMCNKEHVRKIVEMNTLKIL